MGVQGGESPSCQLLLVPLWYQQQLALRYISKRGDKLEPRKKTGKNADLHLRVDAQLKLFVSNKARETHKTINDYCIDILRNFEYADRLLAIESAQKQKIKLLGNIANNLNQLAKHCNSTNEAPKKEILLAIFDDIKKVR